MAEQKKRRGVTLGQGRFVRPPTLEARGWYAPWEENTMREHVLGSEDQVAAIHEAVHLHELKSKLDASFLIEDHFEGEFPFFDRERGAGDVRVVDAQTDLGWTARCLAAVLRVAQRQRALGVEDVVAEAGVRPEPQRALSAVFTQAIAYGWIASAGAGAWESCVYADD